jgi:hypothetical protein
LQLHFKDIIKQRLQKFGVTNVEVWDKEISGFCNKINFINKGKKYNKLLKSLKTENDKNNFFSFCFEVHFAYDFEKEGFVLTQHESTITKRFDFEFEINSKNYYFELRHLFQSQLSEKKELEKVKNAIEEKILKFSDPKSNKYHFIVINISEPIIGNMDKYDCLEIFLGSSALPPPLQHSINGLFHEDIDFANYIHGVIFAKDINESKRYIDCEYAYFCIYNPKLIDEDMSKAISADLAFLQVWNDK